MRKLTVLAAATAALLCLPGGCSKHNAGNSYYFSFQSGAIQYTTTVDSLVGCKYGPLYGYGSITMSGGRDNALTDSAAAGAISLATWYFTLLNQSSPADAIIGTYSTDTSATNLRFVLMGSDFRFYTLVDPHRGQYLIGPGLPFTVTVTQYNTSWFAGTFSGQAVGTNANTGLTDTVTVANGKFRLPFNQ